MESTARHLSADPSGSWCGKLVLAGAVLLLPLALRALDPAKSVFQYNCQNWTRQGGLPADKVNDVTQTKDGYIWLGTQHGLVRFDGLEFKVIEIDLPEAQSEDARKLHPAAAGGLWFANNEGNYGFYDGRKFLPVGDERWATFGLKATTILETRTGAVWTGAELGFGRWVPGKPAETFFSAPTIGQVMSFAEDAAGRVWLGTAEHGLYYWQDEKLVEVPDAFLKPRNIFVLAAEADGRMWVGTEIGLRCYDAQGRPVPAPALTSEIKALLVDRHGVLWVGTTGLGLARYQDGKLTYLRKADGLGSDNILSIFEGTEGSLWVGTRDGLSQLSDLKFPIVSDKDGIIAGSTHWVAAARRGGLWISTTLGLSYFDGIASKNYVGAALLPNQWVTGVIEARNGDIYLADGARNIAVLSGDKVIALYPNASWPNAFAEDARSVLVAVGPLLYRIENGGLQPYEYQADQQVVTTWIHNLCVAQDGAIWLACDNVIVRLKDGATQQWPLQNGRTGNKAQCIFEDSDGAIWAGLTTGLARIKDGQLRHLMGKNDLAVDSTFAIVPDDLGFFWISSADGISRVARQNLNDLVDGKSSRFEVDRFIGLESVKFSDRIDQGFAGCKTLDGRIWFPNPQGVVMIDPAHYFTNPVPPPVHIQAVRVDGVELPDRHAAVLNRAAGRVEFSFAALSYIAPKKTHVRYQLEGFDPVWIEAEDRRSVLYGNLPAGHYRFRVQAANADGIWNIAGDEFGLELPPPYYQTGWFYGLEGLVACLGLLAAYHGTRRHQRISQEKLLADNNLLEAKVGARTKELAASLSLLHATLESTTDGIVAVDQADRIISHNSKFVAMWQFPPGLLERGSATESRSHKAAQILDAPAFLERIRAAKAAPEKEDYAVIELKDGRTFERYAFPQRIAGQSVGTVINWRDITARKRAEAGLAEASRLLEAMLENIPDHIYFKDRASRFVRFSKSLEVSFHLPEGQTLRDKTDAEVFSPEHAGPAFRDEQEIIRTGLPLIGQLEKNTHLDGRVTWVVTTKMPWHDPAGKIIGTFGVSKDITELKLAEEQLELVHKKLLATSRLAGMAEVATGVLHNVGNVLNSVNVSATLVADQVRHSKATNLAKICELLDQHAADLGTFLTTDPKGRIIPAYLATLADSLAAERTVMTGELDSLRKNIDHIKDIVAMQQNYARNSGFTETVTLPDLVDEALRINADSLTRHGVDLVRDYQARPVITTDRHKVMQIIINLVRNAKYACDESGRRDKQITVRTTASEHCFRIAIIDNGVGIPPENLTRIFAHGFTTKKTGHGFGLHSGALAAKELGGALTVASDGTGHGATFTLEIPLQPPSDPASAVTENSRRKA